MTRINTNVSSAIAQSNLARSQASLQTALQRLSTGLRINVGKDDPAGLIASENLRSDITSIERAITNSERANQLIGTADSALGQVSSLLNDIRGLVSEAANTGALSKEQIEANQLQVDSSLEAIDRIAQTTAFQGRKLLDGSLDFTTTSPGTHTTAATAAVTIATDTAATATISAGGNNNDLVITAKSAGTTANGYTVRFSSGATGAVQVSLTGTEFEVLLSGAVTASAIAQALSSTGGFNSLFSVSNAAGNDGSGVISADTLPSTVTAAGGANASALSLTAVTSGTGPNAYTINVTAGASLSASLSGNTFTITLSGANSTAAEVAAAISASGIFTAAVSGSSTALVSAGATVTAPTGGENNGGNISDVRIDQANFGSQSQIAVEIEIDAQATQGALVYSGGSLTGDLILEVGGKNGFEVFNFGSGNTTTQIQDAINLVSDATGISASLSGSDLVLKSTEYGTNSFVSVRALSGSFDTFNGSTLTTRDAGSNVSARINGVVATGDGLNASINTSTLDIGFRVNDNLSAGSTVNFNITGGGAIFQLGPDVVSNQQARLGIQGVNTATLGGSDGTLFELRTGGTKALATDVKAAARVVEQTISKVTSLRGRLGAFQKTTLETNIYTLTDTLSALTDAQSSIRDADFAKETAALTRSQILVQAGTSVLTIANQNPQQVLALLR
jgi:flagellin